MVCVGQGSGVVCSLGLNDIFTQLVLRFGLLIACLNQLIIDLLIYSLLDVCRDAVQPLASSPERRFPYLQLLYGAAAADGGAGGLVGLGLPRPLGQSGWQALLPQVHRVMHMMEVLGEVRGKVQQQDKQQVLVHGKLCQEQQQQEQEQQLQGGQQKQGQGEARQQQEQLHVQLGQQQRLHGKEQQGAQEEEKETRTCHQGDLKLLGDAVVWHPEQEGARKASHQQQQGQQQRQQAQKTDGTLTAACTSLADMLALIPLVHLAASQSEAQLCLAGLQQFPQALTAACGSGNLKPLWEVACGLEGALREYVTTSNSPGGLGGGPGGPGVLPGFGVLGTSVGAAGGAVKVGEDVVQGMAAAWRAVCSSRSDAGGKDSAGQSGEGGWGFGGYHGDEGQQQLLLRYVLFALACSQLQWCVWLLGVG